MFPIEMKHIGKIEAVGTAQVLRVYAEGRSEEVMQGLLGYGE